MGQGGARRYTKVWWETQSPTHWTQMFSLWAKRPRAQSRAQSRFLERCSARPVEESNLCREVLGLRGYFKAKILKYVTVNVFRKVTMDTASGLQPVSFLLYLPPSALVALQEPSRLQLLSDSDFCSLSLTSVISDLSDVIPINHLSRRVRLFC